jgi:hypothetical protein
MTRWQRGLQLTRTATSTRLVLVLREEQLPERLLLLLMLLLMQPKTMVLTLARVF